MYSAGVPWRNDAAQNTSAHSTHRDLPAGHARMAAAVLHVSAWKSAFSVTAQPRSLVLTVSLSFSAMSAPWLLPFLFASFVHRMLKSDTSVDEKALYPAFRMEVAGTGNAKASFSAGSRALF